MEKGSKFVLWVLLVTVKFSRGKVPEKSSSSPLSTKNLLLWSQLLLQSVLSFLVKARGELNPANLAALACRTLKLSRCSISACFSSHSSNTPDKLAFRRRFSLSSTCFLLWGLSLANFGATFLRGLSTSFRKFSILVGLFTWFLLVKNFISAINFLVIFMVAIFGDRATNLLWWVFYTTISLSNRFFIKSQYVI